MKFTPWRLFGVGCAIVAALAIYAAGPSANWNVLYPDAAHPVGPVVTVKGHPNANDGGGLYFVDVRIRAARRIEQWFGPLVSGATMATDRDLYGPDVSSSQASQISVQDMAVSQKVAAIVALQAAGYRHVLIPTGMDVTKIVKRSPAAGKLKPGDVIVAVDGNPTLEVSKFESALAQTHPGDPVSFDIKRHGAPMKVTLQAATTPGEPGKARVGIYFTPNHPKITLPFPIKIKVGNVGGPSAGLPFTLQIYQDLGHNVDRGYKVAATGQMEVNGTVDPIGGIKQKTIGARKAGVDVFLVPAGGNARDARKYAHGLRIIPVENFQQALHALATLPRKP